MGAVLVQNQGQQVSITAARDLELNDSPTSVYTDPGLTLPVTYPYALGDNTVVYLSNGDREIDLYLSNGQTVTKRVQVQRDYRQKVVLEELVTAAPISLARYPDSTTVASVVPRPVWLDVRDFGAVGDRSTDCTATIQAAIDDAYTAGGGAVVLPDGWYRAVNLVMRSRVTLRSWGGVQPYLASGARVGAVLEAPPGTSSGWVIDTPDAAQDGMCILGLGIRGAYASNAGTGGIRFRNAKWSQIQKVGVTNTADEGIWVVAGPSTRLSSIMVVNALLTRSRASATGAVRVDATDCHLDHVESTASTAFGDPVTDSNMYLAALHIGGANNWVVGGAFEISDVGIRVTGNLNQFLGARSDRNNGHGWIISGSRGQFVGCKSQDNGSTTNTYDAYQASGAGNTFVGCIAPRLDGRLWRYCFNDTANNGAVDFKNSYEACRASDYGTAGFSTNTFLGSGPLHSPQPVRPASGTTTPDVTGTSLVVLTAYASATTITNFLGATVGQTIRVLGDSDVTIANNSNIQTSTGADKTLASGLVYSFTFWNNKWYEGA